MDDNKKRRLSQNFTASANKLRLDSINKILKIDSSKGKKHKRELLNKQVSRVALSELLKNNSNGQLKHIPDFKTFISDKDNLSIFRDFLKTQYCHENIDFYLSCEKFCNLQIDRVGKEFIKFMANQIYNDYLAENASQRVNIDYDCLQNIINNIKNPDTNLFMDAQTEIFNLMKTDCYPRFCKTWQIDKDIANKILHTRLVDFTPSTDKHNNSTMISSSNTNCDTTIMSSISTNYHRSHNSITIPKVSSNHKLNSRSRTISSSSSSSKSIFNNKISDRARIEFESTTKIGCPQDCPYFKVGLPCQQHQFVRKLSSDIKDDDLLDKIDMRRLHHVPNVRKRNKTPPPPPLPPKPAKIARISPVINKKLCPYVGKVFNV